MLIEWTAIHSEGLIHRRRKQCIKYNFSLGESGEGRVGGEGAESRTWLSTFLCSQYQTQTSHVACKNAQPRYRIWPKLEMKHKQQVKRGRREKDRADEVRSSGMFQLQLTMLRTEVESSQVEAAHSWYDSHSQGREGRASRKREREREIDRAGNEFKIPSHVRDNAVAETEAETETAGARSVWLMCHC